MDLARVLGGLPENRDPRVLADYRNASDAGVFSLGDELALVQTVDFFTPIVDDPYVYGAVAAANALSDVYAMGGTPLTAISIAGFPKKGVDFAVLEQIFRGGLDKIQEAGAVLLGGHTIQDDEIKFGYAVTGRVHPECWVSNSGAKPGDRLYLTKPIGTGVLATALKRGKLDQDSITLLHRNMSELNRSASEAMRGANVHAATDVTGFGLLGHLGEMARASSVTIEIEAQAVPLLPEALRLQSKGHRTGAIEANRCYVADILEVEAGVEGELLEILLDPQTSGGLVISVPASREASLRKSLTAHQTTAAPIAVVKEGAPKIVVTS